MSEWPSSNDYTAAIQNPQVCFKDYDLKNCRSEVHPITRMPKVWTGNFAQVYEFKNGTKRWAVKCFTRSSSDVRHRYSKISNAISSANLPYFVDFRFINDEMLVGGKRYPIVKMEWVEGQPLDKYVEVNLYRPRALLDLASQLTRMVNELESKGLAHGDIQHGNVLIKNNELKLVDYDGLFVPDFKGTPAPEQGLPSYQHPLRNIDFYNSTLDRFPLLVICTSLCALAVDPSIWYEFSTGENFLFTRKDFENPNNSRLFNKLKNSTDSQVKAFTELLRIASIKNPNEVALLNQEISVTSIVSKPWWVDSSTNLSKSDISPNQIPSSVDNIFSQVKNHSTFITGIIASIGLLIIYIIGTIPVATFSWSSIIILTGYLIERYTYFKKIPVFKRRKELSKRLGVLANEIKQKTTEQNKLQNEPIKISQMEIQEKTAALKEYQERELMNALARIDIVRLRSLRGFGDFVLGNLKNTGINNAADLKRKGWYSVRGIGSVKSSQIRDWLQQTEKSIKNNIPHKIPFDIESRITSKYSQQRQNAINLLNSIGLKINTLRAEHSQKQSEFNQQYIPSFGEFLKHNY